MTPPELMIVADDLTGALDSACEAALRGIATRVFLSPAQLEAACDTDLPPVVAVSTNSRDGSATAARDAMAQVCDCLTWLAPHHVMKKVDSRLKGHVQLETQILMQALGASRITVAPALPDMGRIQLCGQLSGAGIPHPIAVAEVFQDLNTEIPDILTNEDFQTAAQSAGLLVGARSLAGALVSYLWPQAEGAACPSFTSPALFIIGSRDPITLAQAERLDVPACLLPDGRLDPHTDLPDVRVSLVQMVQGGGPAVDPQEAGTRFVQGIAARLLRDLPSTVVVVGGETAGGLMRHMGVGYLDLTGAALPGIPVSQAVLTDGRRFTLLTKSGGFGDQDALARLVGMMDS